MLSYNFLSLYMFHSQASPNVEYNLKPNLFCELNILLHVINLLKDTRYEKEVFTYPFSI